MKTTTYLRFAKTKRGVKVEASSKPSYEPLSVGEYNGFLPTVWFAVEFYIPDELFAQAERTVASINLEMENSRVRAKVMVPAVKKFIQNKASEIKLKNLST